MTIQHVEAEQTVLGALLLDGELMKECRLIEQHLSVQYEGALLASIENQQFHIICSITNKLRSSDH